MEPGLLTQHVGASQIPIETIKETCGPLLERFKIKLEIPGLLFIDTPGHAAFTSIRKRGSSIADLAILVIDITEGIQEQTDESIKILNEFKTPFLVAATKIDKIDGWIPNQKSGFLDSFNKQPEWIRQKLDEKLYRIVGQLSERGFESERFDRVSDFKKTVAIVPCSGITGEGVPELLVMLAGLAQAFLKEELEVSKGIGKGSILEVKEVTGLGTTIDVILYDGEIRRGDWMVVGGKEPIVTRVKALLKPRPLKELRVEKQFENIDYVSAASGVKISAPNLENVIAGSPVAFVSDERKLEETKKDLQSMVEEIEFEKDGEGVILKADNLGSLEALIGIFREKVPIKKAETGRVFRKDVIEIETVKDRLKRVIIAFNVDIDDLATSEARDKSISILQNNVIYQLVAGYDKFLKEEKERIKLEKLKTLFWPGKIQLLPGHTFRQNDPAIVGVEVLSGKIKSGCRLIRKDGKEIGTVESIQSEKSSLQEAKRGEKVAVSIKGPVVGRHIHEKDILYVNVPEEHLKIIMDEFKSDLTEDEILTIGELREIRKL
jgi:translation initiation factor 5B